MYSKIKAGTEKVSTEVGDKIWDLLLKGVLWNSTARIERNDFKDPNVKGDYVTKGNVTEQGILKSFISAIGAEACINLKNELKEEDIL